MSANLIAFGRAVRELRDEKGVSVEALTVAAKLTPARLGGIEGGRVDPPLDVVFAVAEGLGVRPVVLTSRADARHSLERYAQRQGDADTAALVAELAPLVETAKVAGMSADAIAVILDGVQAYEQLLGEGGEA
jgi:transcriptional regulator with XRE-family HTH domain